MNKDRLILGTANFGNPYSTTKDKGGLSKQECFDILDAAWDMGIRWLDTARSYGESENIIGYWIIAKGYQRQMKVISKGNSYKDYQQGFRFINDSLCVYLEHHYDGTHDTFCQGVSIYSPEQTHNQFRKGAWWSFPLNLIDQRWGKESKSAIIAIARSIFIQGQAFKMPDIMGIPFYHLCWNFVYNHPNVDMLCFGVDSVKQLEDIMNIPQYSIDYSKIGVGQWIQKFSA